MISDYRATYDFGRSDELKDAMHDYLDQGQIAQGEHAETARQLEHSLVRWPPTNRPDVAVDLANARAGTGPTVLHSCLRRPHANVAP